MVVAVDYNGSAPGEWTGIKRGFTGVLALLGKCSVEGWGTRLFVEWAVGSGSYYAMIILLRTLFLLQSTRNQCNQG